MTDFRELTNRILILLEKFYRGLKDFRVAGNKIQVDMRHKISLIRFQRVEPLSEQMLGH